MSSQIQGPRMKKVQESGIFWKIRETGLAHVALLLSRTHVPMRAIGLQRLAADVEDFERCAVLETGTLKSQIKTTAAREQRQA